MRINSRCGHAGRGRWKKKRKEEKCSLRWGNWRRAFRAKKKEIPSASWLRGDICGRDREKYSTYYYLREAMHMMENLRAWWGKGYLVISGREPILDFQVVFADLILDNRSKYSHTLHHCLSLHVGKPPNCHILSKFEFIPAFYLRLLFCFTKSLLWILANRSTLCIGSRR